MADDGNALIEQTLPQCGIQAIVIDSFTSR